MLQQILLCFNFQKLPLVSQRSISTHQTNTTSSVGYCPLSTEITPLSFHFLRRVRRSSAALPPLLPSLGGMGGDTLEKEQVWPGAGAGGGTGRSGGGSGPGHPVPSGPVCAAFSPGKQPAPCLRNDGWREVGVALGLRFVGFHLLIPFASALLGCNSHLSSSSAGPAPSDLPRRG